VPRPYVEYVWNSSNAEAKENTEAVAFAFAQIAAGHRFRFVVVFQRSHIGIERDVEVIVEIAPERRPPGKVPASAGFVSIELGQRGARDQTLLGRKTPGALFRGDRFNDQGALAGAGQRSFSESDGGTKQRFDFGPG